MQELAPIVQFLALLLLAGICVGVSVRLGLGPIVGYLLCGVLASPALLDLVRRDELVQLLAECGVVFLLFAIGLELPVARLKAIGARPLLLGLAQIGSGVALAMGLGLLAGLGPAAAFVVGCGLAFSSTAVVIRILTDRNELATRFGRTAFAVLMLQDVAVGPMLVLTLALGGAAAADPLRMLLTLAAGMVLLALSVWLGPRLLERLYSAVASLGPDELLVATTLIVSIGFATGSAIAGLSLGFGGFIAGMLLADTSYRHRVASDIRPFRGLLVGLFFVTVGMELEFAAAAKDWLTILALALAILALKALAIVAVASLVGFPFRFGLRLGLLLAQAGEFAFVLWAAADGAGLLDHALLQLLSPAVAIGLAATPLLARLAGSLAETPPLEPVPAVALEAPPEAEDSGHVVIAGAGRVGTQVAELLGEKGIRTVAIDIDPVRIRRARARGLAVYYGDVCQPEVLESLHIERAAALVLAIDDMARTRQVVALARYLFPELPLFVRVLDEADAEVYRQLDATVVVPEVIETGRHLAAAALRSLADRTGPGAVATG